MAVLALVQLVETVECGVEVAGAEARLRQREPQLVALAHVACIG